MKERLLEFLRKENKSSAQLAEEIGVQASGISHILSGRNNPSLDFTLKMLEKYQFISTDWFLFGKGSMYKEPRMQNLFDFPETANDSNEKKTETDFVKPNIEFQNVTRNNVGNVSPENELRKVSDVVKIVWFFEDSTFEEFYPR